MFVRLSPSRMFPVRLSPSQVFPVRLSSSQMFPIRLYPSRLFPVQLSPSRMFPLRLSPSRLFPVRLSHSRMFPGRLSHSRMFPGRLSPEGEGGRSFEECSRTDAPIQLFLNNLFMISPLYDCPLPRMVCSLYNCSWGRGRSFTRVFSYKMLPYTCSSKIFLRFLLHGCSLRFSRPQSGCH